MLEATMPTGVERSVEAAFKRTANDAHEKGRERLELLKRYISKVEKEFGSMEAKKEKERYEKIFKSGTEQEVEMVVSDLRKNLEMGKNTSVPPNEEPKKAAYEVSHIENSEATQLPAPSGGAVKQRSESNDLGGM